MDDAPAAATAPAPRRFGPLLRGLARSDTGRAAGLGAAFAAANVVALAFTIVFAHLLGASGYGSLAALISAFLILSVPGQALQATAAREVGRAAAAGEESPAAGVWSWLRWLALATLAVAAVSVLARDAIAAAIGVEDVPWAAAATLPAGCAWLLLSVERGALQGLRRYRLVGLSMVGEGVARLTIALALVEAAGLDVTGAFLATGLSVMAVALLLTLPLARAAGTASAGGGRGLRDLLGRSGVPMASLALFALLQNVDVIVVKHLASGDAAGSYAAAAVAAKAIVWVAVGLGVYLLPEAARRTHAGGEARAVLLRTLALVAAAGLPMVAVYGAAAEPLLRAVFGADLTLASGALPWLGLAMTLLAAVYLSVQYLLGLHRASFIWVLAAAAVIEPVLLQAIGARLTEIALALLGLQLVLAAALLAISFRSAARPAGA